MTGKSLPWLPWYHRDFLAATQGWTLLERGAYFMLLNASWEMGPLPADERRLSGIIGAQLDELQTVWPTVSQKFQATPTGLTNPRLEELRAKQLDTVEKRRDAANTRWGNLSPSDASADADADASAVQMDMHTGSGSILVSSKEKEPHFHDEVIALYHTVLPELPGVKIWNDRRRRKLDARILETLKRGKQADSADWWRKLFATVAASDFLSGRSKADWRCPGLEWLLEPRHFDKLVEGGYDNTRGAR